MKASLTLRENPKNPIVKAQIPITIFGIPFRSAIAAGDYDELCISFTTAFRAGPRLKFCYRPNDSSRPFGLILRTGVGEFGSPTESPISMSAEFGFVGNSCRPRFFLHFKPRSGDFSVRKSVESPVMNLRSLPIRNGVVAEEKLNWNWNQLFSGACGVVSDGEVCATTSVPLNRAVVKLGWSMKFPPQVAAAEGGGGGGLRAETLLKEMPYLALRKIAIEKKCDLRGKGDDVAEARLGLKREFDLLKSDKNLLKGEKMEQQQEE